MGGGGGSREPRAAASHWSPSQPAVANVHVVLDSNRADFPSQHKLLEQSPNGPAGGGMGGGLGPLLGLIISSQLLWRYAGAPDVLWLQFGLMGASRRPRGC